ncbi:MAG TPA: hypothetical protein DCF89_06535, partial [Flavobacteriales bacterium]|nr:hypothetical protein [Flavobacteriales bacterium]
MNSSSVSARCSSLGLDTPPASCCPYLLILLKVSGFSLNMASAQPKNRSNSLPTMGPMPAICVSAIRYFSSVDIICLKLKEGKKNVVYLRPYICLVSKPQNIILIVADSLRYDSMHLGTAPGLSYAESHGTKFTEARSAGCWTLPATASLFTGLMPHEHGATSQTRKLSEHAPTLAERLQLDGFKTYQVTANV